jgi:hypothetical protein
MIGTSVQSMSVIRQTSSSTCGVERECTTTIRLLLLDGSRWVVEDDGWSIPLPCRSTASSSHGGGGVHHN